VLNERTVAYGRAVSSQQDWRLREGAEQEVFEELGVELRASLSAYRRDAEEGEDVESVCLCSEWTGVERHCEALSQEIGQECAPAPFVERLVEQGSEHLSSIPLVSLGAALLAAPGQHLTPTFGGHAGPETDLALPFSLGRLIQLLHMSRSLHPCSFRKKAGKHTNFAMQVKQPR
jgi:hypothetical protein